jgi:subtilisin-like proprotein convertase family protein
MAVALALLTLAVGAPTASAFRAPDRAAKPALDARAGERAAIPVATDAARDGLAKRLGTHGTVSADPVTGGLRSVGRSDGFLTGPSADDAAAIGLAYVRAHADAFGLDAADLAQLEPGTRNTSPDGVTHVTWRQVVDGVPAYDSALFANVTAGGRLVNVGGAPVHDLDVPSTAPPLGPAAARAAAQRDLGVPVDDGDPRIGTDPARPTVFDDGTRASLVTVADPSGDHLAWRLVVAGTDPYMYSVLVDAATGAVLARRSITRFASSASVTDAHPGIGSAHTVDLAPWLASPVTSLTGPNAHAYADRTAPDGIGGDAETPPSAGADFLYPVTPVAAGAGQHCPTAFAEPCTWDGATTGSIAVNAAQVTTQLFYLANAFHDWLAQPPIGFTAASYNFETTDPVRAEANDSGGYNNANMSTPPDGTSPRMQMYLFRSPFPAVNGSDDATVVYHEYAHGLTGRLVGNDGLADGLDTRQSSAMGEGWSDWYALDYLVAHGHMTDTPADGDVVTGAYVTDNANRGIRFNALDCRVGSTDAAHCAGSSTAGAGGFTYADLGRVQPAGNGNTMFEVHADGEIWAETLWDLRRAVGATTARGLITSALRLSPKSPSFLDMRDAILQADTVAGGANRATIWATFAARGMGYGARTTNGDASRAVASFTPPPLLSAGAPSVQSPTPLGDGDAALEPGEAARLRIPLTNPSTAPLANVHATLTASTAGVVVGQATARYGTIAALSTAAATTPFAITLPATLPCATIVALTLTVTSDAAPLLTAPVALPTGGGSASVASANVPLAVPDNTPSSTSSSTLTLPTAGRVGHLRVTLTAAHTFAGDLHAWLISPAGTKVDLLEEIGHRSPTGADGLAGIVLDDDAPTSIQSVSAAQLEAITGTYSPNEPLSLLADQDRAGAWQLHVVDVEAGDTGAITAWSLSTDEPTCAATGPALPSATTSSADGLTSTAATLAGTVDAAGTATDGAFQYGTTAEYDATTAPVAGNGAFATRVEGLAPSTTYHFRAVALRDGVVVAVGADKTLTTAPASVPPVAAAPPAPAAIQPPAAPAAPRPAFTISGLSRTLKPDARGRVTLAFAATGGAATGTITLKSATALRLRKGAKKRVLTVGSGRFTIPASGKVRMRLTLTKAAQSHLRKHRTLKVKAAFTVGKVTRSGATTLQSRARP